MNGIESGLLSRKFDALEDPRQVHHHCQLGPDGADLDCQYRRPAGRGGATHPARPALVDAWGTAALWAGVGCQEYAEPRLGNFVHFGMSAFDWLTMQIHQRLRPV